jgi:hypothetical protein
MYATTNTAPCHRTSGGGHRPRRAGTRAERDQHAGQATRPGRLPVKPAHLPWPPRPGPRYPAARDRLRPQGSPPPARIHAPGSPLAAARARRLPAGPRRGRDQLDPRRPRRHPGLPVRRLEDTCAFVGRSPGSTPTTSSTTPSSSPAPVRARLRPGCDDPACRRPASPSTAPPPAATPPSRPAPSPTTSTSTSSPPPPTAPARATSTPPCALIPGPRRRTVEPGLVTDLAGLPLVLGLDDIDASQAGGRTRLDLAPPADDLEGEPCCVPDPACAAANSAPVTLAKPARPG